MHIAHHPIFVALASLTAWLGAWTALDVFRRVRAHVGGWRLAWLAATAVAMGLSIWSMHFIAMLGFNPGAEVRYDIGRTVLSLLLAIATTAFAFFFARGGGARREIMGGVVMGAGICTMHYVGMSAVITSVTLVSGAGLRGALVRRRSFGVYECAVRREERDDSAAASSRGRGARVRDRRHALHGDVWRPRVAGASVGRRIGRRGFAGAGNRSRRRHAVHPAARAHRCYFRSQVRSGSADGGAIAGNAWPPRSPKNPKQKPR